MTTFSRSFLADTAAIIERLDDGAVEAAVEILRATRARGGRLFLCGSGGGAGHGTIPTLRSKRV